MSRLIDADELINHLKKDPLYHLIERYGIETVIESRPTVKAIPLDRVEQIREHFEAIAHFNGTVKADYVLRMLDKALKEHNE